VRYYFPRYFFAVNVSEKGRVKMGPNNILGRIALLAVLILAAIGVVVFLTHDDTADSGSVGGVGCMPLDYKNGVYYFGCTGAEFGNALSRFRVEHPDDEVVSMTGNGTGAYGTDQGYFVVVSPK
jgi:hypothetical protein